MERPIEGQSEVYEETAAKQNSEQSSFKKPEGLDSALKSTCFPCRGQGFGSQHAYGFSSRASMPCGNQGYTVHSHIETHTLKTKVIALCPAPPPK